MTDRIIVYVRSGYTEAQKRATYKWLSKHPEKVKEYNHRSRLVRLQKTQPFYELCQMYSALEVPEFRKKRPYIKRKIASVYDPPFVTPKEPEQFAASSPSPTEGDSY